MTMITIDRAKYVKGARGLNNGDTVAQALNGLTLSQVYALALEFLPNGEELQTKYLNNNPGQQRMHIGNRLRTAIRKGITDLNQFDSRCHAYRADNAAADAAARAEVADETVTDAPKKRSRKKAA